MRPLARWRERHSWTYDCSGYAFRSSAFLINIIIIPLEKATMSCTLMLSTLLSRRGQELTMAAKSECSSFSTSIPLADIMFFPAFFLLWEKRASTTL